MEARLAPPLIVAAYLHGNPSRKRRVKVPPNIKWAEFLALFYSRLDLNPNTEIEVFDERGIEIVACEDLIANDILVVREKRHAHSRHSDRVSHDLAGMSHDLVAMSHDHGFVGMMGTPLLSHFIQSNSFGYYFLAQVDNVPSRTPHSGSRTPQGARVRKTHCVLKVPLTGGAQGTLDTFANEATLLRKISQHKCLVAAPSVQVLNFSDPSLHGFYKSLPVNKQLLVGELFRTGTCLEVYVYPLYGVTMATKIRTGLSPDKVLKYSYQLADVMHYLQQRGVIHLNLLPENIQVMSNDRLVLCNFETAVQTNPTTCLLVASQSIIAPSNKKGLAPEVVTALSRLRIETETVDYSTQYPWSFGVMSVVMAMGVHPLQDYPEAYESSFRVKYRSHQMHTLPDAERYPPIFCKLVKRCLSCDPVRRPTLPQILSIIRKDAMIIKLMSKGRPAAPDKEVVIATTRSVFDPLQSNQQSGTVTNKPHPSPNRHGFLETHPPTSYGFNLQSDQSNDRMIRHASHERYPIPIPHEQQDPYLFSTMDNTTPHNRKPANHIPDPFFPLQSASGSHDNVSKKKRWDTFSDSDHTHKTLPLKRAESGGTFSDSFVPSHTSSGLAQHVRVGSINSECSDVCEEVPYQPLIATSSDDQPTTTTTTTGGPIITTGGPAITAGGPIITTGGPIITTGSGSRPRMTRRSSYCKATSDGAMDSPPLIVRRCFSDPPVTTHPRVMPTHPRATPIQATPPERTQEHHMTLEERSHDVRSPSSSVGGILMSSTTNTQTTPSPERTDPTHHTDTNGRGSPTNDPPNHRGSPTNDPPNGRGLLSPVFSNADSLSTNKQFWASVMSSEQREGAAAGCYLFSLDNSVEAPPISLPLFPEAFSQSNLIGGILPISRPDEDLTPKDGDDITREIPSTILASDWTLTEQRSNVMSPIPEASQELTSSMSQPSHPITLSQLRSASPTSGASTDAHAHSSAEHTSVVTVTHEQTSNNDDGHLNSSSTEAMTQVREDSVETPTPPTQTPPTLQVITSLGVRVRSTPPRQSEHRPLSPLATTTYRSTELLDTVGRTESNQATHGMESRPEATGNESRPDSGVVSGEQKSAGRRYSKKRQVTQDLEMMNLAISGMDHKSSLMGSVRSEPQLIRTHPNTGQRSSNIPHRTRSTGSRSTRRTDQDNTRTRRTEDSLTVPPVLSEPVRPSSAPNTDEPPNSRPPDSGGPQAPSDSYDYLPPYSPPAGHQRHASEPGLLAEPPPSYDEIFGRRRRGERSRLSRRSQSQREVLDAPVDRPSSSDMSNLPLARVSNSTGRVSTSTGRVSTSTGRVSNSSRRLISLTNLFRRSRRSSSQADVVPTDPGTGPADDFTADWVASYSRTPRPFPTTRHEALSVTNAGTMSLVDSSASLPVPYRHPPPFIAAENTVQAPNQIPRSQPPPQHGSSQSLNVLGTRSIVRTRNDLHGNSGQRQARPRPYSSFASPTDTTGSTPSTPNNRTRRLDNSGATPVMSSSCFNILVPTPHTSIPHPHTPTLHTPTRIRAPGLSRVSSGSTSSLQHASQHLSSNANTNNVNAVARASACSSPASHVMSGVECASSASTLVHRASVESVSCEPDASVSRASVESVSCEPDASVSRAAMRLRAETRRLLQQEITVTSEEEQHSEMSNLSQGSQRSKVKRKRRRRSLGSTTTEGQRSTSQLGTLSSQTDIRLATSPEEESHDVPTHTPHTHTPHTESGDRMARVTEERETQSIEVTIESDTERVGYHGNKQRTNESSESHRTAGKSCSIM